MISLFFSFVQALSATFLPGLAEKLYGAQLGARSGSTSFRKWKMATVRFICVRVAGVDRSRSLSLLWFNPLEVNQLWIAFVEVFNNPTALIIELG